MEVPSYGHYRWRMDTGGPILGSSRAALEVREFARIAAGVDAPVLLTGETGTGKGVLAAAIHGGSRRAAGRLVAVNCAGVPESLFESEFSDTPVARSRELPDPGAASSSRRTAARCSSTRSAS
jgi:transcriptional regulator of aromatic amino acid metabolism